MPRRSQPVPSGHTILVVDDQEATLASVGRLLESEGHTVLTAGCGEKGLALLRSSEVHLVIVDYFMPRMNGAAFVREVRKLDAYVQIILQTGYAGEKPPRMMLAELDIQGYHDKTAEPEQLLVWVDVGLKAYRLVRALRDRERLQAELVANCSHELRTPINIIAGYGDLLLQGEFGALDAAVSTPICRMVAAARNLVNIVDDATRYAHGGENVQEETPLDVVHLACELERQVDVLLDGKPVHFGVVLDQPPLTLVAGVSAIRRILRNLVMNAAKFTEEGRITLRIFATGEALRCEIRDTGPGIAPEDQERVFDAFRQLDGSNTRRQGGLGLGLALSRRLARALGGDVHLESHPGIGSRFTLVLPLHLASAPGLRASAPHGA